VLKAAFITYDGPVSINAPFLAGWLRGRRGLAAADGAGDELEIIAEHLMLGLTRRTGRLHVLFPSS